MRSFFTTILLTLGIALGAQTVQFKHEYYLGTTNYSALPGDVHQMPDGGFLFTSGSGHWPDSTVLLIRTDKWGTPVWTRTYLLTIPYYYPRLIKHNINRYTIFTGQAFIGIDSSGTILWSTQLNDEFKYCSPTKNSGLVLQGQKYDSTAEWMMSVVKMDSVGNIMWSTSVDSLINNGVQGIVSVPLANGSEEYVLLGTCYSEYNYYQAITCISENGTLLWNKLTLSCMPLDLVVSSDSSILMTGVSAYIDSVTTGSGIVVLKMRSDGIVQYSKTLGPFDASWSKVEVSGDTLLLSGMIANPNYFGQEYNIAIDTNMNFIWQRRVAGGSNTYLDPNSSSMLSSDGGYAQLTSRQSAASSDYNLFLIKANPSGNALCYENNLSLNAVDFPWSAINDSIVRPYNIIASPVTVITDTLEITQVSLCSSVTVEERNATEQFSFTPNPANNQVTIEFKDSYSSEREIRLYNVQGQEMQFLSTAENHVQLDITNLNAGLYIISVDGHFMNQKLVISH